MKIHIRERFEHAGINFNLSLAGDFGVNFGIV